MGDSPPLLCQRVGSQPVKGKLHGSAALDGLPPLGVSVIGAISEFGNFSAIGNPLRGCQGGKAVAD